MKPKTSNEIKMLWNDELALRYSFFKTTAGKYAANLEMEIDRDTDYHSLSLTVQEVEAVMAFMAEYLANAKHYKGD